MKVNYTVYDSWCEFFNYRNSISETVYYKH